MKNFQIVNLAHEDKLIYINSYLHSLKGMAFTPVSYERSTRYSAHEKGNTYLRTFPIVGEDWQVVDDEWESQEMEYGFWDRILGKKGDTIPLANTAFHFALENAKCHPGRTSIQLLNEATRMGVTFTDEGYCRNVELNVSKGAFEGCYVVGNIYDIDGEIEATGKAYRYPVANVEFRLDGKDTPNKGLCTILNEEELTNLLKRTLGGYTDFFHRSGLRISLQFADEVPDDVRKQLRAIVRKVNSYLEFLDDINEYETDNA